MSKYKKSLAYIIGISLGDGNLSNPNGRAVRLRITCDNKYQELIEEFIRHIKMINKHNRVSIINRRNCVDISCYSNNWEKLLGWKANLGSKERQRVSVPVWIINDFELSKICLRGLLQTDGSIYKDRKYLYVNFTSIIPSLVNDVNYMIKSLGFKPTLNKSIQPNGKSKYVLRICKNATKFIDTINLWKR